MSAKRLSRRKADTTSRKRSHAIYCMTFACHGGASAETEAEGGLKKTSAAGCLPGRGQAADH